MIDFSASIGGQDISSHVVGIYREHSICEATATIDIRLDPTWGESPSFQPYDEIIVAEDGVGVFRGYVTPIDKQRMDPRRTISGQDATKKIQDTWIADFETGGSITPVTALTYLFTESGLTEGQYNFLDTTSELLPDKDWTFSSAWDICEEILTMMGWQLWSDGDGVIQVGQIIAPPATHTFQSGVNLIGVQRRRDDSYTRTAFAVYGSGGVSVKKTAAVPIIDDGMERAAALANPLIATEVLANEIATRALDEFNQLLDVKTCEIIGDPTVQVADSATVIESFCDLNVDCLITSVRSSLDGNGYTMTVVCDERCPTIWGFSAGSYVLLYAATNGAGVYRSQNLGESWSAVNGSGGSILEGDALYVYAVEANINDQNDVWAGTLDGLYRSLDGGGTWGYQDMGGSLVTLGGEEIPVVSGQQIVVKDIDQDELHPERTYFLAETSGGSYSSEYEAWIVCHSGGSWSQWPIRYI